MYVDGCMPSVCVFAQDHHKPIVRSNIALLHGFLGGIDEAHFYLITTELEAVGAPVLKHMLKGNRERLS